LARDTLSDSGVLQVKVAKEVKDVVNKAIKNYASKHKIRGKDFPTLAGKVLCHLLGILQ
jgi:ribosomal protein L22